MDVILDTNIYREDFRLNNANFQILQDYINKTNSKIILPQIIKDEVEGLFIRSLKDRINAYVSSVKKLNSLFFIHTNLEEEINVDINNEVTHYVEYIIKKFGKEKVGIITYKNEFLPELINRSITRKKPFDSKGQQFRDCIIWLTLIDYANTIPKKEIIFISRNTKDFGEGDSNKLNQELKEDIDKQGIEIKYFKSLTDFAKYHASRVDFIDDKWINENINIKDLISKFEEAIDSLDNHELASIIDTDLDSNESLTGLINRTEFIESSIKDYYVNEISGGLLILNLQVKFELEYESEIESFYNTFHNRTYDWDYILDHSYRLSYPVMVGYFMVKIMNQKVISTELVSYKVDYHN